MGSVQAESLFRRPAADTGELVRRIDVVKGGGLRECAAE